ncbi:hypothetical protein TELCIR_03107 [Teladorsagia circumcincta]|uniref:Uncharacterized protein n=1 Tax=Teladorsagia circumcincta TaxID=45464 RepID=A0A2G9UXG8_TELCI|nr:hypothetical protein TELCIR_03107 [Teladorsagia circumcincta]
MSKEKNSPERKVSHNEESQENMGEGRSRERLTDEGPRDRMSKEDSQESRSRKGSQERMSEKGSREQSSEKGSKEPRSKETFQESISKKGSQEPVTRSTSTIDDGKKAVAPSKEGASAETETKPAPEVIEKRDSKEKTTSPPSSDRRMYGPSDVVKIFIPVSICMLIVVICVRNVEAYRREYRIPM